MSERYKQVRLYDSFKFSPTCPIDILKGAIYIDTISNKAVFQLKFVSMQEKNIKALYIQIKGYNDLGKELTNKEYEYLDLNISKGQEFGTEQLKELNNNTIRNIEITINKIIYADNGTWENKSAVSYDRTKLQHIDSRLLNIAKQKAIKQGIHTNNLYYPTQNDNYWTCVCGAYNSNKNEKCYNCEYGKELVVSQFSKIILENELKDRQQQERRKIENNKSKLKRLLKGLIIFVISLLCISIFIYNAITVNIAVYLENDIINKQDIKEQIESICKTDNIEYISNEKALKDMNEKYGIILEKYNIDSNIFHNSFELKIRLRDSEKIEKELLKINGVQKVVGNNKTIKTMLTKIIFAVFGVCLFVIIIIIIKLRT